MQKSTGGARPRVPSGESSKARGLAPHARAMRSEGAPEAGSRRRSRGKRWRALRGTCRGKALRVGKVASFDERAMEAILVLRTRTANAGRARRARGSARGRSPVWHAVENAAVGQPVRMGSAPPNWRAGGRLDRSSWCAVKHATTGGPDRRKAGRRQRTRKARSPGSSGESRRLWSRTVHECSIRQSVAEVGEEHLPVEARKGREAQRAGNG